MNKIYSGKTLIAIVIRDIPAGSIPQTEPREPLQLVTLNHKKGSYLKAHMHKPRSRNTKALQECLIVKKGQVEIDLYDNSKKLFKTVDLQEGEVLILMSGGYGIHLIKDSELIEVKNGPFKEDKVLL